MLFSSGRTTDGTPIAKVFPCLSQVRPRPSAVAEVGNSSQPTGRSLVVGVKILQSSGTSTATKTNGGSTACPTCTNFSNAQIAIEKPQYSAGMPTGFQRPPYKAEPAHKRSSAYLRCAMRHSLTALCLWQSRLRPVVPLSHQAQYLDSQLELYPGRSD